MHFMVDLQATRVLAHLAADALRIHNHSHVAICHQPLVHPDGVLILPPSPPISGTPGDISLWIVALDKCVCQMTKCKWID